MINQEDKQTVLKLILEVCKSGARKSKAAQLLGLTIRTLQRWGKNGLSDNRKWSRAAPGNKLSDNEKTRIASVLESPEFAKSNPNQIVPRLADQGVYLGSESTMYRTLRKLKMNIHRQSSLPAKKHSPDPLVANAPNQLWSWDITYLPSTVRGRFSPVYGNGSPMKCAAMLAKLQDLGVIPSFSRMSSGDTLLNSMSSGDTLLNSS